MCVCRPPDSSSLTGGLLGTLTGGLLGTLTGGLLGPLTGALHKYVYSSRSMFDSRSLFARLSCNTLRGRKIALKSSFESKNRRHQNLFDRGRTLLRPPPMLEFGCSSLAARVWLLEFRYPRYPDKLSGCGILQDVDFSTKTD